MPARNDSTDRSSIEQLAKDFGLLFRSELELARAELMEKAKSVGVGAGMLSASAIAATLTLLSLTIAAMAALALVVPVWLSAAIVALLWAAATVAMGWIGKKKIQDAGPMYPEQTIRNLKEDVGWNRAGEKSATK